MYAVAYDTGMGFGSVGLVMELRGKHVFVRDPVLGDAKVAAEDCYHLIWTEAGHVLPFVTPIRSRVPISEWLLPELPMAANRAPTLVEEDDVPIGEEYAEEGDTGFEFGAGAPELISGYPKAWERIRVWREGIAPDWRTVALVTVFAVSSIMVPIETAEDAYRSIGPLLRKALEEGTYKHLDPADIREMPKYKQLGYHSKAKWFLSMMNYAPWLAAQIEVSRNYERTFRDMIAIERMDPGLGMAKLSFSLMLLGRDGACFDTRMMNYFWPDETERLAVENSWDKPHKAGATSVSRRAVNNYRAAEEKLRDTQFFDPDWPCPYAKAQWMLWETMGRPDSPGTDHGALWEVLGI